MSGVGEDMYVDWKNFDFEAAMKLLESFSEELRVMKEKHSPIDPPEEKFRLRHWEDLLTLAAAGVWAHKFGVPTLQFYESDKNIGVTVWADEDKDGDCWLEPAEDHGVQEIYGHNSTGDFGIKASEALELFPGHHQEKEKTAMKIGTTVCQHGTPTDQRCYFCWSDEKEQKKKVVPLKGEEDEQSGEAR